MGYTYRDAAASTLRFAGASMLLAKDIARQRVDKRRRGNHGIVPGIQ